MQDPFKPKDLCRFQLKPAHLVSKIVGPELCRFSWKLSQPSWPTQSPQSSQSSTNRKQHESGLLPFHGFSHAFDLRHWCYHCYYSYPYLLDFLYSLGFSRVIFSCVLCGPPTLLTQPRVEVLLRYPYQLVSH